jgi:UDP-2-acetamido-3-amino-2,3-dideoxy-glucuronate N-acetyltransferase
MIPNYSEITAVVIAVPATLHYEIAKKCLLMNLNIFVEKPLALHYHEGLELVELAKKLHKVLMVGHLLQYHPAILKIKDMIKNDMIGTIQYIKSNRLNLGQIRSGENVLWSLAPHDISVIISLFNNHTPKKIICSGFSTLNPPISDISTTILHFDNQYAEINVNWLYPYKEHNLVIVGEKGMITFKEPLLHYYPQPVVYENGQVVLKHNQPQIIECDITKSPLILECEHFIDCCTHNTKNESYKCRTDGEEALRVLAVLEIAQNSLSNGGFPQNVDEFIHSCIKNNVNANKINTSTNNKSTNNVYCHPTAIIDTGAQIGKDTKIWHYSHIMKAKIGEKCSFGQSVFVANDVVMGNNCRVQNNVNIFSGVTCEDNVFFGPNCTTTNDKNPRTEYSKNGNYLKTHICKGATIGASAVILSGITLGKYCMIGAGSVVTKDVPDYALVVGNPARIIGKVDEKGNRVIL